MKNCPLCHSDQRLPYPYKTYATCAQCRHTYQPEPPSKTYQNPDRHGFNGAEGAVMGDHEKSVNMGLAHWLAKTLRPRSMLDVGCAYPYLAYCFGQMGINIAALDGVYKTENTINNDLNVPVWGVDWEDMEDGGYDTWKGVELITMIHVLEHFKDPLACLKRAYDNLADDGTLYIRSPNKNVSGIERDHTDGHVLIHPNIFGDESLLFAANKIGFHLHWVEHMSGYGQSSWIFKKRPPKVSLFMIVKNEENNIVDCLNSVRSFVDEIIVLDTGSTDKTIEVAIGAGAQVYVSKNYDQNTTYEQFDFSKARNEAMGHATGDWLLWMDADDRLEAKDLKLEPSFDAYYVKIKYGNTEYNQVRLFRNNWGVLFYDAVHEWPDVSSCRLGTLSDPIVHHKTDDKPGRIERNLAILYREHKKNPSSKRIIFYLANALRENGQYDQAIAVYNKYVSSGSSFKDEVAIAKYYIALCYYCKRAYPEAIKAGHEAIAFDDRWGEPYALIGESYHLLGQHQRAINYLNIVLDMPIPATTMFIDQTRYRESPRLWLSYCYEKLGQLDKAKEFASGNPSRLKELAQRTYIIELNRPGALGDVLATTPVVRELRKKYPNAHIRYVTHKSSVQVLRHNPDINEVVEEGGYADRKISFSYPMHEGYPDKPMNRHLCQYFAENASITLPSDWAPVLHLLPEDTIRLEHKKPVVTFAVKTGWSRYKEWPLERWADLIKMFPQYQWIQLGADGEPRIEGAQYMCGKLSLRESFSVMQQSVLFVGLDSIFNHATAALQVPAVILFGSTSPTGSGYRDNLNLWSEYACSPCYIENPEVTVHPKPPCPYSHKCMVDYMTVETVAEAIRTKLNIGQRKLLAVVG